MAVTPYVKDDIWTIRISHKFLNKTIKRTISITFTAAGVPTAAQEASVIAKEASIAASSIIRERDAE